MGQEELAVKLAELDERCRSNTHRIDEIALKQTELGELMATVKVLASRQEKLEYDVREIKTDVKSLTQRPGKRWDALVDKSVWAIAGGLLSLLMMGLGG